MSPVYRRIAIAAFAALAGLCFAFIAPVIVAPFVVPNNDVVIDFRDLMEHAKKVERAGFVTNGLWLAGMVTAAGGALYGLAAAVFSKPTPSPGGSG